MTADERYQLIETAAHELLETLEQHNAVPWHAADAARLLRGALEAPVELEAGEAGGSGAP